MKTHEVKTEGRVYIADSADVIGNVTLKDGASVWNHATIRGDRDAVVIGRGTNVQDNAVIHEDYGKPVVIGDFVTVGHSAIVHGAKVGDNTLVGMHATVMNGAVVGEDCIIGAGALVTEGTVIPAGSLVVGVPGKVIKAVSDEQRQHFRANAMDYVNEAMKLLNE